MTNSITWACVRAMLPFIILVVVLVGGLLAFGTIIDRRQVEIG
jgi:hypothetical protein